MELQLKEDGLESGIWEQRLVSSASNLKENERVDESEGYKKKPEEEPTTEPTAKTEAEAVFRILDLHKRGFITKGVKSLIPNLMRGVLRRS